jgi:tRNA A37 threonylcarbamoyladenosine dehydratase
MPKDLDSLNLKFRDWLIKIITLLNHHQIQLTDVNKQIWCIMRSKDNEKVQVTLFERIETN